jgi:hypothetical protein
MQNITGAGKSLLKISLAYLPAYVPGERYKLQFFKQNCDKRTVFADTSICEDVVLFHLDILTCFTKGGTWEIDFIKENETQRVYTTKVHVTLNAK